MQHGFPLSVVRVCIVMYRGWQIVVWDGVLGGSVRPGQTLAFGCVPGGFHRSQMNVQVRAARTGGVHVIVQATDRMKSFELLRRT